MINTLRNIDLNLLVTLDALLSEHSVTRAAERLHLSQPTVSVQLASWLPPQIRRQCRFARYHKPQWKFHINFSPLNQA